MNFLKRLFGMVRPSTESIDERVRVIYDDTHGPDISRAAQAVCDLAKIGGERAIGELQRVVTTHVDGELCIGAALGLASMGPGIDRTLVGEDAYWRVVNLGHQMIVLVRAIYLDYDLNRALDFSFDDKDEWLPWFRSLPMLREGNAMEKVALCMLYFSGCNAPYDRRYVNSIYSANLPDVHNLSKLIFLLNEAMRQGVRFRAN